MILAIFVIFIILILASCVKIVPQAHTYVLERLGTYQATWTAGLHMKVPLIDRVARKVTLKEQVVDFAPQPVITKDNVTMRIDTVVFFQITDPKLFVYGVENPIMAIENLTATTLRNIIGDLELDETLTSRETINTKMRATLDEATDPWGIKVNRVELKNIIPPAAIQDAMEKQMKAERERREQILIAEGEKKSAILRAEGHKHKKLLRCAEFLHCCQFLRFFLGLLALIHIDSPSVFFIYTPPEPVALSAPPPLYTETLYRLGERLSRNRVRRNSGISSIFSYKILSFF